MNVVPIDNKVVFVILHYMNKKDTVECIESIRSNVKYINKKIVIVDNASPNNSGAEIQKDYKGIKDVYVLLNSENVGFAKGNNIGYFFAKTNLKADFIVCLNNDTVIKQVDFCEKLIQLYNELKFDLIGPDIVTKDQYHQNPLNKHILSFKDLRILKLKKFLRKILNEVGLDIYIEKSISNNSKIYRAIKVEEDILNCGLHGSCVIFSKSFIDKSDSAFCGETFMYFEEDILFLQAHYLHYHVCYSGKLQVHHKEFGATQTIYKNYRARKRNYYKNIIQSISTYERLLKYYKIKESYNDYC